MDNILFECFDYYHEKILNKPENVQYSVARFLTHIINPSVIKDSTEVEILFFEQIRDHVQFDKYELMENKDRFVPLSSRSVSGEYFTPERMARYGREVVKETINIKDYYIWDVSCGSGNLWRTDTDYDPEKLFMSTLNQEDVDLIRNTGFYSSDVTIFACDFLKSCDYDTYNTPFLNTLPEKLQWVIRTNQPLLFFFNPPFKAGVTTPLSYHMAEVGQGKNANDLYTQFIFKVFDMINKFNLTNAKVVIYSPATYLKNKRGLMNFIYESCKFDGAYLFNSTSFSETSDTGWFIAIAFFSHKTCNTSMSNGKINFINVKKFGQASADYDVTIKSSITLEEFQLESPPACEWANTDIEYLLPRKCVRFFNKYSTKQVKVPVIDPKELLGYCAVEPGPVKEKQSVIVMSAPPDFVQFMPITTENLYRVMLYFCAFRTAPLDNNMTITNSHVVSPQTDVPKELYINMPFLFISEQKSFFFSNTFAYPDGDVVKFNNRMFYMDRSTILEESRKQGIEDVYISALNGVDSNEYFLNILKESLNSELVWKESVELYNYLCKATIDTLALRKNAPKEYGLNNWDAGWIQIRYTLKEQGKKDIIEGYQELMFTLRDKIFEYMKALGVYAYDN